jgi:hypothetical protein
MAVNAQTFGTEPSPIWAPDKPGRMYGDHLRVTQVAILSGLKVTESRQTLNKFWKGMWCSFMSSLYFGRTVDNRGNEVRTFQYTV